jgi:hypothetical protein
MAAMPVDAGDPVMMVGYSPVSDVGDHEFSNGEETKRWGRNKIDRLTAGTGTDPLGYITLGQRNFRQVYISSGDSGGPLFNDKCQLVGIAKGGDGDSGFGGPSSLHIRIHNGELQEFLKFLSKTFDVNICGLSNNDDACPTAAHQEPFEWGDEREFPCRARYERDGLN